MERAGLFKIRKVAGAAGVDIMIILLIGMIIFNILYQLFSYYTIVFMVRDSLDAAVLSAASENYMSEDIYMALRENNTENLNSNSADVSEIKENLISDLNLYEDGNLLIKENDGTKYYTISITNLDFSSLIYSADVDVLIYINTFGYKTELKIPVHSEAEYKFRS